MILLRINQCSVTICYGNSSYHARWVRMSLAWLGGDERSFVILTGKYAECGISVYCKKLPTESSLTR